jgi:hypothetical protein
MLDRTTSNAALRKKGPVFAESAACSKWPAKTTVAAKFETDL